MMKGLYREITLSQIPRIMGLGDRNPNSKTFGCFDRNYWHYKLIDLPNVRFQEVSLLLACLYQNEFGGNIYFNKGNTLEWVEAAIRFWTRIQNRGGSFNEVYPNERSFCATSFSTYAVTESLLILNKKFELEKIKKAGCWLSKNDNREVSNQMAAAALALQNVHMITKDEKFRESAEKKVEVLIKNQSEEGFYPEYGGFDIGYNSITMGLLYRHYLKTNNKNILSSLKESMKFMEERIFEDGSYDYSNTSRKTQFMYPYVFFMMGSDISNRIIKGLKNNSIINPSWMDDRYVIQLTTDYLETYLGVK